MKDLKTKSPSSVRKTGFRRARVGGPEVDLNEQAIQRRQKDASAGYKPPILQQEKGTVESTLRANKTSHSISRDNQNGSDKTTFNTEGSPASQLAYEHNEGNDTSDKSLFGEKKSAYSYFLQDLFPITAVDSEGLMSQESELVVVSQRIAYLCIAVTAIQLTVLLSQLILCGVASVDINPMVGPFPDAFSEWGGKNAYLMIERQQYFRLLTPVFLHVGVLHLLVNAFCQLETCAYFEREWGSGRWLFLYVTSGVGCVATSSGVNPDSIGVCSSGALMGLLGAKIAHVITWAAFDLRNNAYYDTVHLDQLSGVMCSTAIISIMSFCTYIDFSGHMGGLATGFLGGMFVFSHAILSPSIRVIWGSIGLLGLVGGCYLLTNLLRNETFPDEDLADACSYFRNLYPEGYDCECAWD
eukprot:scaffold22577_cov122-Cylindrotheca_fusiformis.AAC.32